jgi:hypothetical protein
MLFQDSYPPPERRRARNQKALMTSHKTNNQLIGTSGQGRRGMRECVLRTQFHEQRLR